MGLACRPGAVQQDGQGGPGEGGADRDQGDLSAGHAAGDDSYGSALATGAAVGRRQRIGEGGGRGGQGQHGADQGDRGGDDASEVIHGALLGGRWVRTGARVLGGPGPGRPGLVCPHW